MGTLPEKRRREQRKKVKRGKEPSTSTPSRHRACQVDLAPPEQRAAGSVDGVLMTPAEASLRLGLTPFHLRALVRSGEVSTTRRNGQTLIQYSQQDVYDLINRKGV
jgi:hypothetical protein